MIDVVKELQFLGYPYIDKGNSIKVCCPSPSHNDSRPSVNIRKDNGVWNCLSCPASGNMFTFAKLLGKKLSLTKKDMLDYSYEKPMAFDQQIDYDIVFKGRILNVFDSKEIRDFLWSIGIYDDDFIRDRQISYCNYGEAIGRHLIGTDNEKWSKYNKRILFPVYNHKTGKMVQLEGRTFDNDYLKIVYPKGSTTKLLYNYEFCDLDKPVIVVEGIKDLCKVWNVNTNVVSSFSANILDAQIDQLMTFKKEIVMFIDNDKAGWNAVEVLARKLVDKDLYICYASNKGQDPNDCTLYQIKEILDGAKIFYMDDQKLTFGKRKVEWI